MFNFSRFELSSNSRIFLILCFFIISCHWSRDAGDGTKADIDSLPVRVNIDTSNYNELLPSIGGRNPYGDSVDIRHIHAKFILVEFWASWCPPCRRANPALVQVYKKYKNKGFEIISISLDTENDKWKKAIESDGLLWPYHICDYNGWDSKWAREYQIEEIPNNILYNSEGKIIARSVEMSVLNGILEDLLSK